MPGGCLNFLGLLFAVTAAISVPQSGTAISSARPFGRIRLVEANPDDGDEGRVNPMDKSLKLLVVPVLPAAGSLNPSRLTPTAVPAAITSAIMLAIRNAVVSPIARDDGAVAYPD